MGLKQRSSVRPECRDGRIQEHPMTTPGQIWVKRFFASAQQGDTTHPPTTHDPRLTTPATVTGRFQRLQQQSGPRVQHAHASEACIALSDPRSQPESGGACLIRVPWEEYHGNDVSLPHQSLVHSSDRARKPCQMDPFDVGICRSEGGCHHGAMRGRQRWHTRWTRRGAEESASER
jgi:hypothetical protein